MLDPNTLRSREIIQPQVNFAIKGIVSRTDGKVLIIATNDSLGRKIWDLPGGRRNPGETADSLILRKLPNEISNIPVSKDQTYDVFTAASGPVLLGREVDGADISFGAVKISVDNSFVPVLTQHSEYTWVDQNDLENLKGNQEILLQDWTYNLLNASFKGETAPFIFKD